MKTSIIVKDVVPGMACVNKWGVFMVVHVEKIDNLYLMTYLYAKQKDKSIHVVTDKWVGTEEFFNWDDTML